MKAYELLLVVLLGLVHNAISQAQNTITSTPEQRIFPDLYEASVIELQDGLKRGHFSSVDLVKVMNTVSNADTGLNVNMFRHISPESMK